MANDLTDFFRDMGHDLFGSGGFTSNLASGWHDLAGKQGAIRDFWSGPPSGEGSNWADRNLLGGRNFARIWATSGGGGDALNSIFGGNWGGSAINAGRGLYGALGGLGGSMPANVSGNGNGLTGMLGGGSSPLAYMPPINTYQDPLQGSAQFSPGLMAFLAQLQQGQVPSMNNSPMISGGGAI